MPEYVERIVEQGDSLLSGIVKKKLSNTYEGQNLMYILVP